jgi:hypothetical protein
VNPFRAQVAGALEAMTVRQSGSWAWCGRRVARSSVHTLPPDAARAYRVAALERVLYESFYCPGAPTPHPVAERRIAPRSDPAFVEELSAANAGRGCWTEGWRIEERCGDDLVVGKDGLRVLVAPSHARAAVGRLVPGGAAQVRLPKELAFASPGYYTALSDTELHSETGHVLLRLYFHVAPSAAPKLMAAVTSSLNGLGIPFRLKVVDAPEQYSRCDAAVLYVGGMDFGTVRPLLRDLLSWPGVRLRERTPALTKTLRPGIGLAEQPASGDSFGTDRCRLLAEGIVDAHDRGARRPHERLAVVAARFASRGVDLEAPYLEPGSNDRYAM